VVEVHGSIRSSSCPRCAHRCLLAEVLDQLAASESAPRCPACGTILKPDVVFFEELLPEAAIDRAYELAGTAGLLVVIGSSLEVWPVAELPSVTQRAGGTVAIVNTGETTFDHRAALKVEGIAGDVLQDVLRRLSIGVPPTP
jgi:NAD-dependent deacetylase